MQGSSFYDVPDGKSDSCCSAVIWAHVMGIIYCLFSTEDGIPRYIGQTRGEAKKRHKHHLAAALDKKEKGRIYDWMREVLRKEHTVGIRVIQDDIAPIDLDTFESYWIEQFPNLIN